MPVATNESAAPWIAILTVSADLLSQHDQGEVEGGQREFHELRVRLAASPLAARLSDAGYEIHHRADDEAGGTIVFWWTLLRRGWSSCEVGDDFVTREEAVGDAVRAMLHDSDIGWREGRIVEAAEGQFTAAFKDWLSSVTAPRSGLGAVPAG